MSNLIPVKKGATSTLVVAISFGISLLAVSLANSTGITIPEDKQTEIAVILATGLSGVAAGAMNWFKHRKKTKVLPSNPAVDKLPDSPQV